ncbi:hypothetical protein PIB30_043042 [Stylosanthes scabra]|uniref:Uncharacterized protein n=1 Tax=Stylosanthes scabra TaxID=79078 RepID=A0ABU6ZE63_9FABA|nr:hypothetical protein [Stylosanthes scabra]
MLNGPSNNPTRRGSHLTYASLFHPRLHSSTNDFPIFDTPIPSFALDCILATYAATPWCLEGAAFRTRVTLTRRCQKQLFLRMYTCHNVIGWCN